MSLEALESRVVWILGGPRTGSTWLLDMLSHPLRADPESPSGVGRWVGEASAAPRVIPVNEPYIGVHLAPIATVKSGLVLTAAEARELNAPDPSYFFNEGYAEVWRPALRRLILERLAAQAERAGGEHGLGAAPVLIKEPNGSHAAPALMSTLPRSRLLFLLRDGRDVLDSMLDAVTPGGWLAGPDAVATAEDRLEFLRTNAALWLHRVSAVERAVADHPRELSLTVRYEDLRSDTAAELGRIESWLGLRADPAAIKEAVAANSFDDYPSEVKGRGKPLRSAQPGGWRANLSVEEQGAMLEIIGDKLAELGY